jgi:hypothetical protein
MHHYRLQMARWQRLLLLTTAAALLLTGLLWMLLQHGVGGGPNAAAGDLPHPALAGLMRVHGAAGFAGLFMCGVLAAGHVQLGWRLTGRHHLRGQRRSGLILSALAAALVLTGYLLYYFAPEQLRPALGWLHTALGLLMAGVGVWHARHRQHLRHTKRGT